MEELVLKLRKIYPEISFVSGEQFMWSPSGKQITYVESNDTSAPWSLLHELGHAELGHKSYSSDAELLQKEVTAWSRARELAQQLIDTTPTKNYIEDCLDTYRDWVHKRSTCPTCTSQGLQMAIDRYTCINCLHLWKVSSERFCRPYRISTSI